MLRFRVRGVFSLLLNRNSKPLSFGMNVCDIKKHRFSRFINSKKAPFPIWNGAKWPWLEAV